MLKYLPFYLILLVSCKGKSQASDNANHLRMLGAQEAKLFTDSIKLFMDSTLNNAGFSGGILVAKNDQILYEHYQGFSDSHQKIAINDSTPFHVASTSKTFTAHAIFQLVKAGKISYSDSLEKIFPGFPYPGITIKHLITHTSGIPNYAYFMAKTAWPKNVIATNTDMLNFILKNKPALDFKTGARFKYCNTNFALLALIVEKASGIPFPKYVQDSIFIPSGMTHSYVMSKADTNKYLPSFDYRFRIHGFENIDAIYGDKNVFTTCRDLMKYDSAIRNFVLADSATYANAWQPLNLDKHYHDSIEHYGMGWRIKYWNPTKKIVYHNGWWHGNNSVFQRLILDTAVIIVTGNKMDKRIYHVPRIANVFRHYFDYGVGEEGEQENIGTDSVATKAVRHVVTSHKRKRA